MSDEFEPLDGPLDRGERVEPPELYQISARLRGMKKPKSQVEGESLVTEYADLLAIPLAHIFGQVFATLQWPDLWKRETVTVIPKGSSPSSIAELRNLSCTPLFSKLLESFVLDMLKEETNLSRDQYGGIKGSGPDHFLTITWQEILDDLDHEDGAAATLTSIDFAKAFNRMSHQACLEALLDHGAKDGTVALVSAFLSGRTMAVRLGSDLSTPRLIKGGSPQGSILGNYLFCMTTDCLGDDDEDTELAMSASENGTPAAVRRNRERIHLVRPAVAGERGVGSSDSEGSGSLDEMDSDGEYDFRFFRYRGRMIFDTSDEDETEMLEQEDINYVIGIPDNWVEKDIRKCIYIDDYNCIEKVREQDAISHHRGEGQPFHTQLKHNGHMGYCKSGRLELEWL